MMRTTVIFSLFFAASWAVPAHVNRNIDMLGNWKVVGGSTAAPGQFPFIISLRLGETFHTCGGSLIRKDWVVTAAHCVAGGSPSGYTVVAGTNQISTGGVKVKLAEIVVHPDWNPRLLTNDVALLRLATPVVESDLIQVIDLATDDVDVPQKCTLAGWGRTAYPGTLPNDLQFLDLLTIPYLQCKDKWSSINTVVPTEICTFTKAGEGACHGDSGGPLIAQNPNSNSSILIGLVSWGQPCAKGMPDVYTRVSSYAQWINDKIRN